MYEQVFQLNERPFTSAPNAKHYFPGFAIDQALAQSKLAIDRATGPVIIVGPTGSGKSLLLTMLAEHYREQDRSQTTNGKFCR